MRSLAGLAAGAACLAAVALAPASAAAQNSLYDQLGEKPGISRIVGRMLAEVTADPQIRGDFDNINLDWLKGRLTDFLCVVSGGPCAYKGRPMHAAHAGLHLTDAKFNAVAEHLQSAMQWSGVSFRTQNRLLARLAPMEREVVTR